MSCLRLLRVPSSRFPGSSTTARHAITRPRRKPRPGARWPPSRGGEIGRSDGRTGAPRRPDPSLLLVLLGTDYAGKRIDKVMRSTAFASRVFQLIIHMPAVFLER